MVPAWRNFKNIFFTKCTWPNRPVGAKILSGFQFEGKTDVWISQVRRVKPQVFFTHMIGFHMTPENRGVHLYLLKMTKIWQWIGVVKEYLE